ncbi:hypothetical protein L7F22_010708 [Adiantum nelumboides]|nr:hypothetical protein [Adiantum nelumboides]
MEACIASLHSMNMGSPLNVDALLESLSALHIDEKREAAPSHEELLQGFGPEQASSHNGGLPTQKTAALEGASCSRPTDGGALLWAESLVQEMQLSNSLDDARQRAAMALQAFQKHVLDSSSAMHQAQQLAAQNQSLKKAVLIQHHRHLQHHGDCSRDVPQMKELTSVLQKQVRALEFKNYALNMHLQKAPQHDNGKVNLVGPPQRDAF